MPGQRMYVQRLSTVFHDSVTRGPPHSGRPTALRGARQRDEGAGGELMVTSISTQRTATPSMLSGVIVSLVSILLSLLIAEGAVRWIFRSPYEWDRRLMFFSEGHNFRNTEWGGFVYQPHAVVHAQTYYITELQPPEVRAEYDVTYTTNAAGLVQLKDFTDSKPAILLLGDSFAEGQGAHPWFYGMERDWPEDATHQIVNGGILGTGVEAWGRLYRKLSRELAIRKIVILFISDDWTRPVWQFPQQTLDCLKRGGRCMGFENFYGLPEEPLAAQGEVRRIARYRIEYLSEQRRGATLLARSAVWQHLVSPASRRVKGFLRTGSLQSDAAKQFAISKDVVTGIVNEVGRDNVLFMYIPQKTELGPGPNRYGRQATEFIRQSGLAFVDGRSVCGLSIGDYFRHDGHPNARGYAKIATCVERAIKEAFQPL